MLAAAEGQQKIPAVAVKAKLSKLLPRRND